MEQPQPLSRHSLSQYEIEFVGRQQPAEATEGSSGGSDGGSISDNASVTSSTELLPPASRSARREMDMNALEQLQERVVEGLGDLTNAAGTLKTRVMGLESGEIGLGEL